MLNEKFNFLWYTFRMNESTVIRNSEFIKWMHSLNTNETVPGDISLQVLSDSVTIEADEDVSLQRDTPLRAVEGLDFAASTFFKTLQRQTLGRLEPARFDTSVEQEPTVTNGWSSYSGERTAIQDHQQLLGIGIPRITLSRLADEANHSDPDLTRDVDVALHCYGQNYGSISYRVQMSRTTLGAAKITQQPGLEKPEALAGWFNFARKYVQTRYNKGYPDPGRYDWLDREMIAEQALDNMGRVLIPQCLQRGYQLDNLPSYAPVKRHFDIRTIPKNFIPRGRSSGALQITNIEDSSCVEGIQVDDETELDVHTHCVDGELLFGGEPLLHLQKRLSLRPEMKTSEVGRKTVALTFGNKEFENSPWIRKAIRETFELGRAIYHVETAKNMRNPYEGGLTGL